MGHDGLLWLKLAIKTAESNWAKRSQLGPGSSWAWPILTRSQIGPRSQYGSEQIYALSAISHGDSESDKREICSCIKITLSTVSLIVPKHENFGIFITATIVPKTTALFQGKFHG